MKRGDTVALIENLHQLIMLLSDILDKQILYIRHFTLIYIFEFSSNYSSRTFKMSCFSPLISVHIHAYVCLRLTCWWLGSYSCFECSLVPGHHWVISAYEWVPVKHGRSWRRLTLYAWAAVVTMAIVTGSCCESFVRSMVYSINIISL